MRLRHAALMVALGAGAVALLNRRRAELSALPSPAEEGSSPAAPPSGRFRRRDPSGIVAVVDDLLASR